MFTQREEGEVPKEVKDLERGPWDLGLCSPTPSGLVNLCEETSEVIPALPSHKLPNQCQLSEPLCSALELPREGIQPLPQRLFWTAVLRPGLPGLAECVFSIS